MAELCTGKPERDLRCESSMSNGYDHALMLEYRWRKSRALIHEDADGNPHSCGDSRPCTAVPHVR